MKVLALIWTDERGWDALSDEERKAVYEHYEAFERSAAGKIAGGAELAPTRAATTVRVRDGQTLVTDGPFAETREQLGGFYVLDVESLDEATALAAQVAAASTASIELRTEFREDEAA